MLGSGDAGATVDGEGTAADRPYPATARHQSRTGLDGPTSEVTLVSQDVLDVLDERARRA